MVADNKKILNLLKTARGQIDTVIKMAEEDRYCVDIATQILAVEGLLNTANKRIITAHLKHCVNNAETEDERDVKIDEMVGLMARIMK